MLSRHEPGTHERSIEWTRHLVAQKTSAIRVDPSARHVPVHAGTLVAMAAPVGRTKVASETPTLKIGDPAPAFTLRSHDGREIALGTLRGRKVVLAFFAFAFTNT